MTAPTVLDGRHRLTTVGLVTLVTFVAFEAMAVATVLPTAVAELDGLAWYGWPFTAFLVAQVVGMVIGGDLGDRRGARVALLWGVAVFAVGLVAAGLAVDMALFVVGRAVQGLGGGFISVAIYVVAGAAFEPRLRPALFGALAAAWVVPALVGPLLAGVLTSAVSWRLVFLGILPLVAAGLVLVLPALRRLSVPDGRAAVDGRRRWWALLSGTGVAALQYAGQRLDLVAVPIAALGLVALVLGLGHLLPRGTARAARGLPTVVASRGLLAGAFFGVESLIPLSLAQLHGFSPTAAGIPLTAGAVGWSVASGLQGRRPDLSRVRLLRVGFGFVVIGVAGTASVAVGGLGGWPVYATWAVAGLGMGLGMSSVSVLLLEQSPEHRRGTDSASLQIADVTGSALCIGAVGVLVSASTAGVLPLPAVLLVGVAGCTAVGAVGWAICGRARVPTPSVDGAAPTLARS
ncbi:Predicted arabinose efflux permease, MFS family [Klenkia soli]|uniref:Predicted arabinose efflux permease, MFS family n=1 Tax=Klenkia soli TaxID=1052260 RepID=A0A1H0HUD2_9ACTN|nr:MFS transporter [Klenkia soli]SDO22704.1 Predicted arabinose efflux permease, MFS family [Klenkia soli]